MAASARLRYRVISTGVEGVAAQQPSDRQEGSPKRAMSRDRLQGVRAARRVEPTAGRQRRAYPTTVRDDGSRQHSGTECHPGRRVDRVAHRDRRADFLGARAAARAASRSAPSRAYEASAASGSARTTRVVPAGSPASRSRTRCRSRRRTRFRITAPPTALETTKPARTGADSCSAPAFRAGFDAVLVNGDRDGSGVPVGWRWTTRTPRLARRPPRIAAAKSLLRRSRCAAASTTAYIPGPALPAVRPTGGYDPCHGGQRGWRGPPGCACAAGSRGSSRGGGCSAGRCACSRQALRRRTPRPCDIGVV